MATNSPALIDDRLLVDWVLSSKRPRWAPRTIVFTTQYWYYRATRAAVAGAGGQLSGPFAALPFEEQAGAIEALLGLPDDVGLSDPRALVPEMVEVSRRHGRLNLMNVEAVAAARLLEGPVMMSAKAAGGVLPAALEAEGIPWSVGEVNV